MKPKQKIKKKKKEVKFKARKGSPFSNTQAGLYGNRIYQLMKAKGKTTIKPSEVVEDAKNATTPYHDYFTWDDKTAGDKCRLQEARQLLNSIVIVNVETEEVEPVEIRAFVNVIDLEGEKGYIPIDVAISEPQTASQIVAKALKEAKSWHERYLEYQELARIHKAIQKELTTFQIEED